MRQHLDDSTPSARGDKFSTCRIRPSVSAPLGFTLVELLVVIGIIGMITAIAVPTIFSAVASARNAKTKAEIDMLHIALMNYKNEYGSLPPANMAPVVVAQETIYLWNTTVSPPRADTRHPVFKHLARVFPRINEPTQDTVINGILYESPYKHMAAMSPAQALVFWLAGFYENPEYPLTNGGSPGSRKKLFDFDESRLYAASSYAFDGTPQIFAARGTAGMSPFPVYFTGHPSCGLPYVYLDSRCYANAASPDIGYIATNKSGDTSAVWPYFNSLPPAQSTWAQKHMNPDTFQLVAGGKDGLYGPTQGPGVAFPRAAGTAYSVPGTSLVRPFANDPANAMGHADNLTNFADRAIGDAIESLLSQ